MTMVATPCDSRMGGARPCAMKNCGNCSTRNYSYYAEQELMHARKLEAPSSNSWHDQQGMLTSAAIFGHRNAQQMNRIVMFRRPTGWNTAPTMTLANGQYDTEERGSYSLHGPRIEKH